MVQKKKSLIPLLDFNIILIKKCLQEGKREMLVFREVTCLITVHTGKQLGDQSLSSMKANFIWNDKGHFLAIDCRYYWTLRR